MLDPTARKWRHWAKIACIIDIFYLLGFVWIFNLLEKLDRKSTRLNSSHLVISYAVFCLKKKMDLTVLRGRLPGQDARLPAPRLDARRLPRDAAARPGRLLGRALDGRRVRLPAARAAAVP